MKKREYTEEGKEKIRLNGYNEWLNNSLQKHEVRFDYSNAYSNFRKQKEPQVEIRCKKHDVKFNISPYNHLRSLDGGCKHCELETTGQQSLEREWSKFLSWFTEHRSNNLEMRSEFKGMTSDMDFYCKIHDHITTTKPTYLMVSDAYGCDKCSRQATTNAGLLTIEKVRNDLEMDFPDHVQIISVFYDQEKKQSYVQIKCEFHGEQNVTKGTLKRSYYKCPKCGDGATGYSGNRLRNLINLGVKGRPTYLGVMEVEVFNILSLKVGVTTRTLEDRYKWHLKKIIFSVQMSEVDAYILENKIHRTFSANHDLRIFKAGMRNKERWAGDTECYWYDRKDDIIEYIKNYFREDNKVNYEYELDVYEVPNFFPRDKGREKSEANKPTPIIGINPDTNEVEAEFPSLSDAIRSGYSNLSTIIYNKNGRRLSGGLRWFKLKDFDPLNIPPLPSKNYKTTRVQCVETGVVYNSINDAEKDMLSKGHKISGSKISSVCSGKRKTAGKFHWKYI